MPVPTPPGKRGALRSSPFPNKLTASVILGPPRRYFLVPLLVVALFHFFSCSSKKPALTSIEDRISVSIPQSVHDELAQWGEASVLIELHLPKTLSDHRGLPEAPISARTRAIRRAQTMLFDATKSLNATSFQAFRLLPWVALRADHQALTTLVSLPEVSSIVLDKEAYRRLDSSTQQIGVASLSVPQELRTNPVVAIIDDGVESSHPFFGGHVLANGACFQLNLDPFEHSNCPGGWYAISGPGAGEPSGSDAAHGTHVAGIAAGLGSGSMRGVASGADILPINVFHEQTLPRKCFGQPPCLTANYSSVLWAIEHALQSDDVAAINMSLGSTARQCKAGGPERIFIEASEMASRTGAALIAASGNLGDQLSFNQLDFPACVDGVVSVASVDSNDAHIDRSQISTKLDFLAPGDHISSAALGGGFRNASGTSMAAPHVAGAIALIRAHAPYCAAPQIVEALKNTGIPVEVHKNSFSGSFPRIQVDAALASLGNCPPSEPKPTSSAWFIEVEPFGRARVRLNFLDRSSNEDRFEARCEGVNHPSQSLTKTFPPNTTDDPKVEAIMSPLLPSTLYRCQVRACRGTSCSSWVGSYELLTASPNVPDAPSSFQVISEHETSIRLSWNASAGDVQSYRLGVIGGHLTSWQILDLTPDQTEFEREHLDPDETYSFYLRACNAQGCSGDAFVAGQTRSAATPPQDFQIVVQSPAMAQLAWRNEWSAADRLILEWSYPTAQGMSRSSRVLMAHLTSYSFTKPTPGLSYTFQLKACQGTICSRGSNIAF